VVEYWETAVRSRGRRRVIKMMKIKKMIVGGTDAYTSKDAR
jgi:hypothetical protein